MFKNILVALDGSEHAIKAARIAREMAICLQAAKARKWWLTPAARYFW